MRAMFRTRDEIPFELSQYDKTVLAAVSGNSEANDKLTPGAALWMTAEFLFNRGYMTRAMKDGVLSYELTTLGRSALSDFCILTWDGVE